MDYDKELTVEQWYSFIDSLEKNNKITDFLLFVLKNKTKHWHFIAADEFITLRNFGNSYNLILFRGCFDFDYSPEITIHCWMEVSTFKRNWVIIDKIPKHGGAK